MNGFENNNPYDVFDRNGRRKNKGWSIASATCSTLSLFMCIFGWAGLIFGILGIVFAIVSRAKLGYFNSWSVAGILIAMFGIVFSASMIVISFTNPELVKEIFGFTSVPGTTVPTNPNTTNRV